MSDLSEKMFERALQAIKEREFDKAQALLVETIKLEPNVTDSWVLRGNVLCTLRRWLDAILHYDRALGMNEKLRDAWNNRGTAFAHIGMWQEAERSFKKSIEIVDTAEPHVGLANMYHSLVRLDDCEREFRHAIELDNTAGNHFNLALVLLGMGRWQEAWKEYEYRWLDNPAPPRAFAQIPRWRGESLKGKTILLCPEQGYGDEIMSWRFANKQLLGADSVIVQARSTLFQLAKRLEYDISDVTMLHGEIPDNIDYCAALLDVPGILGLTHDDIPRSYSYLTAPPERSQYWADRIKKFNGLRVGLCWSSGSSFGMTAEAQAMKSIPVQMITALRMPDVHFFSLQKPLFDEVPVELGLTDWMGEVEDFADTAALIENLDLVITVDTAVAHLSGALGVRVWNFVRFAGFFPWVAPEYLTSSEYSVWYPSMRLFRQPALGNWHEPLTRARNELQALTRKAA